MRTPTDAMSEELTAIFRDYPPVMKVKEVASALRINRKTVYAYAAHGDLPNFKLRSNLLFLKTEVIRWVQRQNPRFRPDNGNKRRN